MIKYWILVNFDELDSILNDRLSFRIFYCQATSDKISHFLSKSAIFEKALIFRDREFSDFELRVESELKKLPPIFSLRKIPKVTS